MNTFLTKFLWVFLLFSELCSRIYIVKSTILFVLSVSLDFLHEMTLLAIGIDNIGCLEPF